MSTYFCDAFGVRPAALKRYGAFNVSLVTDLPLFIDPFLLFNSKKRRYQELHESIIRYLSFLRDKSVDGAISPGGLRAWYFFPEVKQNWFGFSLSGNAGTGLGKDFAAALHSNLHKLFPDFGDEKISKGSHLEKLCLIADGVGRDNISDFTTNLIKGFLCEYTQKFALEHLQPDRRKKVSVPKAFFNYDTESWVTQQFELPWIHGDYVLLTPRDVLTKDENWINKPDLIDEFEEIPNAIFDSALRAQVSNYFRKALAKYVDKKRQRREPTNKEYAEAARRTLLEYPKLIDYYIKYKEEHGDKAVSLSSEKVSFSEFLYVAQVRDLQEGLRGSEFYKLSGDTYDDARQRLLFLKDVIENKGGHRIFYINGKHVQRESDVHVLYRLVWFGTPADVSREVNDGRGPADFKVSRGAKDKTIIEFKLAKNTKLERNLNKQAAVYERASDARRSLKAIIFFSNAELLRVKKILKRLKLEQSPDVVVIDARQTNKPSGSRA